MLETALSRPAWIVDVTMAEGMAGVFTDRRIQEMSRGAV